ncbi:hypothetical protein [Thermococcus peptonophilus]|uniref:hypothetical protein n=1 Tax=Thermococcus peptonophilus TaxID=53952 RepID=UPI0034662FE1
MIPVIPEEFIKYAFEERVAGIRKLAERKFDPLSFARLHKAQPGDNNLWRGGRTERVDQGYWLHSRRGISRRDPPEAPRGAEKAL